MTKLKKMLSEQKFGILATLGAEGPYQNIVAFAAGRNLKHVVFATPRETNKYKNLTANGSVSLFVDDRSNSERDLGEATGICAIGEATEIEGEKLKAALDLYSAKHPALKDFAESPATAMFSLRAAKYLMVTRFQNVLEIRP